VNDLLTLWTIRIACALYVAALLTRRRWLWTAGLAAYLAHVAAAFTFHHHWSHAEAYRETARRTGEMFGTEAGSGLWFNYAFTAVWTADAAWMCFHLGSYRARPAWIAAAVHGFLAFMFFNATVVFAQSGWVRWAGVLATLLVLASSKIRRPWS